MSAHVDQLRQIAIDPSKVTARVLARKLGLARSTVSMALRDHPAINERTRTRVHQAADRMGYAPNGIARAMVTGRTNVIGFITDQPEAEHVARMFSGIIDAADAGHYFVKSLRLVQQQSPTQIIRRCVEQRLAGVICLNFDEPTLEQLHDELGRYGIPIAVLGSSFAHPWGIRVISDDVQGVRLAVQHLAALGHRRMAHIGGAANTGSTVLRAKGFTASLLELGLIPSPRAAVVRSTSTVEQIEQTTRELLQNHRDRPSAIFCGNDHIAMAVARTARAMGLTLPRDLSIVGFSNLVAGVFADPPMTTIDQPFVDMGATVFRLLAQAVEEARAHQSPTPVEQILPTQLIVRQSTAPFAP